MMISVDWMLAFHNTLVSAAAILPTIPIHEYGHYLNAKMHGIYEGYGILPTPHIKIGKEPPAGIDYLWGVGFSYFWYPMYSLISGYDMFSLSNFLFFSAIMFGQGLLDVVLFFYYKEIAILTRKDLDKLNMLAAVGEQYENIKKDIAVWKEEIVRERGRLEEEVRKDS
jgi:hypothetical protein